MKKLLTLALTAWLTGCVSLSYQEKIELMKLQQKGIDATVSANGWDGRFAGPEKFADYPFSTLMKKVVAKIS